jgi:hypothetical protein
MNFLGPGPEPHENDRFRNTDGDYGRGIYQTRLQSEAEPEECHNSMLLRFSKMSRLLVVAVPAPQH